MIKLLAVKRNAVLGGKRIKGCTNLLLEGFD